MVAQNLWQANQYLMSDLTPQEGAHALHCLDDLKQKTW